MLWILLALVLTIAVAIATVIAIAITIRTTRVSSIPHSNRVVEFPYQPRTPLFSPAEQRFLSVLDHAVGSEHRVFGKVRVADVAAVKPGLHRSAQQGALNRIAAKHFDYVVCRVSDLSVVCAVELNDKSHASQRAQARDELVANVCRVINLPLLTVPARATYSADDVRAQFLAAAQPAHVGGATGRNA